MEEEYGIHSWGKITCLRKVCFRQLVSSSCSHSLKVSISQVIVSWEYIVIYFSCEYELQFTSPLFQKYFVSEFHRLITHCLRKWQFSLFPQSAFIFIVPGCKVGIYSISFVFSSQTSKIPIPSINWNISVPGRITPFSYVVFFTTAYGEKLCGSWS